MTATPGPVDKVRLVIVAAVETFKRSVVVIPVTSSVFAVATPNVVTPITSNEVAEEMKPLCKFVAIPANCALRTSKDALGSIKIGFAVPCANRIFPVTPTGRNPVVSGAV